jgi:ATP-binding cassette subfamily C protein LapB
MLLPTGQLKTAAKSGLLATIQNHPKGLDLPIAEGGKGLSGGQRQLVALTRLLLSNPSIWLLDEPTASMDEQTERRSINALMKAIKPEQTMVLVTHKPNLLAMVNRLIVISGHQILIDGPRDVVIAKLQEAIKNQQETAQTLRSEEKS